MIISIDIETTGLDPENCQILEIGMVTQEGKEFHCYVDNGIIIGEAYALRMNQKILKNRAAGNHPDTLDVYDVVKAMKDWLPDDFTVVGKNFGVFDLQFLKKLPGWDIKINYRIMDVGNLYWRLRFDGDTLPSLKICMQRAGILGEVPHTALEDAKIVMELVLKYRERIYDS